MATKQKLRIRIDLPAEADKAVAKALRAAAKAFSGATIEEAVDAPSDSYSLTVHAYPEGAQP